MARLILLNGMPGIGKSTLAERYADDHPGVLNLDVDRLGRTMGGDFASTAEPAQALALTMATARLREGEDVVVPQLLARADQIDRFPGAAAEAGADLVGVLLIDEAGAPENRYTAAVEWTTGTARYAESSIARVGRGSSRHTGMGCGRSSPTGRSPTSCAAGRAPWSRPTAIWSISCRPRESPTLIWFASSHPSRRLGARSASRAA